MSRNIRLAIAIALVLGTASAASAEDSSSSFTSRLNAMTARAWGGQQDFVSRSVALHHRHHVRGARSYHRSHD